MRKVDTGTRANMEANMEHAPAIFDAFQEFLAATGNTQWVRDSGTFLVTFEQTEDEKLFNIQSVHPQ